MNKLSRKDIAMLEVLAVTEESKGKLAEYVQQREKAAKTYKAFREAVVSGVEVEKVVEPVKPKCKFKVGDKVRVTSVAGDVATTSWLKVGDVTEVVDYKKDLGGTPTRKRPVIVREKHSWGSAYFEESSLELVKEKIPNELRAEAIQRAKEFVEGNEITMGYTVDTVNMVDIEFVVNEEKRVVVALVKGVYTKKLRAKGIAKCNPDDVFNADIGKAIALGRALGKDVSEFENAVQPDKECVE